MRLSVLLTFLSISLLVFACLPTSETPPDETPLTPAELLQKTYLQTQVTVTLQGQEHVLRAVSGSFDDGLARQTAFSIVGETPFFTIFLNAPADPTGNLTYTYNGPVEYDGLLTPPALVFTEYTSEAEFAQSETFVDTFVNAPTAEANENAEVNMEMTFTFYEENFDLLLTATGMITNPDEEVLAENVPISMLWEFR